MTTDRAELRSQAQQLVLERRFEEARPLLGEAASRYRAAADEATALGRSPMGELISLMWVLNYQVRCAAALADYRSLVSYLAQAVRLRRELSLSPAATASWRRLLDQVRELATMDTQVFGALANRYRGAGTEPVAELLDAGLREAIGLVEVLDGADRVPDNVPDNTDRLAAASTRLHDRLAGTAPRLDRLLDALLVPRLTGLPGQVLAGCRELAALLRSPDQDQDSYQRIAWLETALRDRADALPDGTGRMAHAVLDAACGLAGSAARIDQQAAHLRRMDLPSAARRVQLESRTAVLALNRYVDGWRALIETDWDRIQAMETAQPFYRDLVGTLSDLGAVEDAMAASEMARARAFADLVRAGPAAPRAITPVRLREAIDAHGWPVVEYYLDGNRMLVFTAVPGGQTLRTEVAVDVAGVTEQIARFHELVPSREVGAAQRAELGELLRALGAALWDPVPGLPSDRELPITVVPHGPLMRVPFAALRDRAGDYLVHRHPLVLLPAASILPELMARRPARREPRSLCVLVDPEPMPGELAPLGTLRTGLRRLAAREPGPVQVHAGPDASVRTLRAVAGAGHSVLCLATHAQAFAGRDGDPMDSYFALAPDGDQGGAGRVTARDVHQLDLDAELVLLAACETGAGQATSDGVIGLSRAFLSRRCGGVLMSLAKVGQEDTLRLVRMFLDAYRVQQAARALRTAQAELAAAYPDEPHRWAPFALLGLGE